MKLLLSASAFAIPFMLSGCSSGEHLKAAEQEVAHFHQMLDAGQFERIYKEASPDFRKAAPQEKFAEFAGAVHRKLGRVRTAERQGFNVNYGTGGTQVTLSYQTQFANGPAVETFVYRSSDAGAKLVGYNIDSDVFVIR
jgi:hypothetical protein